MSNSGSGAPGPDGDDNIDDNGLMAEGSPSGTEKAYDYEPGGHHPVHLRDLLHQRYKVLHKLGSGGYANVWLCCDSSASQRRYVALKIIMAEGSTADCPELRVSKLVELGLGEESLGQHFCLPLDRFEIDGPNGVHYTFVYPVLGSRVSRIPNIMDSDDPGAPLRELCFQTAHAMAALHEHGICHGDFRPANILTRLSGLDDLSEHDLLGIMGTPRTTRVLTYDGDEHDKPFAPQYLVYPIDWDKVASSAIGAGFMTNTACVTDFGECYEVTAPAPDLGIPQIYCSPEYALEGNVGVSCDVWALGCTLFEIRTGRKLFNTHDDDVDEYLFTLATVLGKLPEPWWSETWTVRTEYFEDEADADGRVVATSAIPDSAEAEPGDEEGLMGLTVVIHESRPRSLREAIAKGLYYEHKDRPGGIRRDICDEEADLFSDLLGKLLRYSPSERISPRDAVSHPWFKFGTSGC